MRTFRINLSTMFLLHTSITMVVIAQRSLELKLSNAEEKVAVKTDNEPTVESSCNTSQSDARIVWMRKVRYMYQHATKNQKVCANLVKRPFYCSDPGKCTKEKQGVAVLSYKHKCAKCLGNVKGWILYLFLATFPTTVFFLIVFGCGIKATSAPMNAFVCLIQIALYSTNVNIEYYKEKISTYCNSDYYMRMLRAAFVALDLTSIWNLDFFRYSIPQFCINGHLKTTHIIAMEYIVAVYPLVCIAALYICIELHDRDFKPLVLLWRPFRWCLSKSCFKNYNPKMSIIEVFATFLLLAYYKLLFTSFNLVGLTTMYIQTSNKSDENFSASDRMLYDISVPYLGSEHLPFFILAIFVLFIFNLLPFLLLLLYPTKLFQKALGCCTRVQWHPLHAFADAFQGCYKNGTNGTKDCRYFAALYLLVRALFIITGFFIQTDSTVFTVTFILICHTFSMLFGMIRPYRDDFYNKMDMFFFFITPIPQLWFGVYENKIGTITEGFIIAMAFIYYLFIATYKTLSVFTPGLLERLKHCFTQRACLEFCKPRENIDNDYEQVNQNSDDDDEVFDRLENPQNYQQLKMSLTVSIEQDDNNRPSYCSYGSIK